MGSIMRHGLSNIVIVSDAAGQFKVFNHAGCWVHTERVLSNLIPANELEREVLEKAQFWSCFNELKAYKQDPQPDKKVAVTAQFDNIFTAKTDSEYPELNEALASIHKRKEELLLVLDHPHIPLSNNISENDIREVVKKRKISAGPRSDAGRDCRDTFLSLKKTCKKLGISFWDYLLDRMKKRYGIPPPSDLILAHASSARPP